MRVGHTSPPAAVGTSLVPMTTAAAGVTGTATSAPPAKAVASVAPDGAVAPKLEQLLDLPIVGDVRGTGFFYAVELVNDKETKATFDEEECETLLRGFLSPRLFERGLICRADDRGDPVLQISPPLVAGEEEIDQIVSILGDVLGEAWGRLHP
jgi:adenosylmethionine-8-amino-7-oxononanoate aminotransferase